VSVLIVRLIGSVALKGRAQGVDVYALLGDAAPAAESAPSNVLYHRDAPPNA